MINIHEYDNTVSSTLNYFAVLLAGYDNVQIQTQSKTPRPLQKLPKYNFPFTIHHVSDSSCELQEQ